VATLDAGDRAAFPWPSFASYVAAAACSGAGGERVALRERGVDLDALLEACRRPRAKLAYVANPNNPTGTLLDRGDLRRFLDELPGGVLCVLDEAYAEYSELEPEGPALLREGAGPLCVLRTFSKVYGLAALRVGYALASPEVADALDRVRPVFNVNQPAQDAALASLGEADAVALRVQHARAGRELIRGLLADAGLTPVPSQTNFVYADVPDGDGEGLARRLLEQEGVIVRALTGFGAPGAIRVTVGSDEENDYFGAALRRVAPALA
jgi:histidinol-phosphate aminotransferase